ncbi:CsgG/HfaB family protein [Pseudomonas sp. SWRI124]|nr:CsgG/HfaB family protein [Pseudomonas khavaziana]
MTVSAIKAAMYRFGQSPTDIFKEVTKTSGGYQVVMRDDFQLTLTDRELAEGARAARFVGADKGMLKDAQFLFAVSAKRAQMENNDRTAGRSFQAAIRSLNNGEDETGPGEGFMRLGLKKHMKKVSVRDLANGQLGMCNRAMHSVAVINGREELWGRQGSAPTRGQAVALI